MKNLTDSPYIGKYNAGKGPYKISYLNYKAMRPLLAENSGLLLGIPRFCPCRLCGQWLNFFNFQQIFPFLCVTTEYRAGFVRV
jgi:hypothetical protein